MQNNDNESLEDGKYSFLPVLNIGLGGTGSRALLRTKSLIKSMYGEIPPFIQFLAIDTDENDLKKTDNGANFDTSETFHMKVANIRRLLQENPYMNDFVPKKDNIGTSILEGAGQIRVNGRIALFHNFNRVVNSLNTAINVLRSPYNEELSKGKYKRFGEKLFINVVCSISGGTGSGTFLDIPYLIKKFCDLENTPHVIRAFLLLPDVYQSISGEKSRLKPNAYGALKELDMLMSEIDKRNFKVQYNLNGDTYPLDSEPYHSIFLIGNENTQAGYKFNNVDDIVDFLGSTLYLTSSASGKDLNSALDNIRRETFDRDRRNRLPLYSGFGMAEIFYDGDAISELYCHNLLRYSIIENWLNSSLDVTSQENELFNLLTDLQIREEESFNELIDRILPDPINLEESPQEPDDFNKEEIISIKDDYLNRIKNTSKTQAESNSNNIRIRVCQQLNDYFEKSLFCIGGVGNSLTFAAYLTQKLEILKNLMHDEAHLGQDSYTNNIKETIQIIDISIEELDKTSGIFSSKKKKIQIWNNTIRDNIKLQAKNIIELERRERAIDILNYLKIYVEKEIIPFLDRIKILLEDISQDSINKINELTKRNSSSKIFRIELHKKIWGNIKVEKNPTEFNNLVQFLRNDKNIRHLIDLYIDKSKLISLLLEFCSKTEEANKLKNRLVEDVFEDLDDKEKKDILDQWMKRSYPIWQIDTVTTANSLQTIYKYAVTNKNKTIFSEEHKSITKHITSEMSNFEPVTTGDTKRIFLIRYSYFIPAYALSKLESYKNEYENEKAPFSFHISKEWEEIAPELIPEDGLKEWSLCFVFSDLISIEGSGYYKVYSQKKGNKSDKFWFNLNEKDRAKAFKVFSSDKDLVKEILNLLEEKMNEKGERQIVRDFLKEIGNDELSYVKQYSKISLEKYRDLTSINIRKMIKKELNAILEESRRD